MSDNMGTAQPFSLFPNSVPRISMPNPHNRQRSLHQICTVTEGGKSTTTSPGGESVVLKMEEEPPVPNLPADMSSRSSSLEDIGRAVTTTSPLDGTTPSPSIPSATQKYIPPAYRPKAQPATSPEPGSVGSGSATLVQGPLTGASIKSPIVPIRSMFPTFDPSMPLQQQNYYPQRPLAARLSAVSRRDEYRDSLLTPIDRAVGARTAPASIVNFPHDVMSIIEPHFSSHRELEKLWEATHGTELKGLVKTFDLEMTRKSEATFTFGADPGFPFYTLKTFDTHEIHVSKTCPRKRTSTRDVVLSSLEPDSRRLPPGDGLVTFIFPKLAAMMAINQSAALAREHGLVSTDREDIEAAAVRRAAQQEACSVRWNARYRRYELEHPAITRRQRDPDFSTSPQSPDLNESSKPCLYITISSHLAGSPMTAAAVPPVIMVTNPSIRETPASSDAAGIRLSTIPQSDLNAPLASLDFGSLTLHIDAQQILELMPSLFAIDAVVSAIMAIAVVDEATNPCMAAMDICVPRSVIPKAPASVFGGASVKSYAGSHFYATIAEREEAEEEARAMRQEHEKDLKHARKPGKNEDKRTWYGKTKKEKSKKKQIVIGEFDLEKLGHYQAGERKGQELPGVTRGLLSGLILGLKLITWILTMVVQLLAWILVSVSRAVTSEKF